MRNQPQLPKIQEGHPIATYSILGVDPEEDLMGVAVQSHYFAVGSMAPWAEAGVGVVIIQSIPKMAYDYGLAGLRLMRSGRSARYALDHLLERDARREYRQVAMVDAAGGPVNYTGESCVAEAGQVSGPTFACQANMMEHSGVPEAMADAFESTKDALPQRLLVALRAAESKGGDIRGKQSAALIVVKRKAEGHHLEDRPFDLRVDDHQEPLQELERLTRLKSAYHHNTRGDAALAREDFEEALRQYKLSEEKSPGQNELHFWRALALLNQGRERDAWPLLQGLCRAEEKWLTLYERVSESGLVEWDQPFIDRLRASCESDD